MKSMSYLLQFANRIKGERGCAFCDEKTICALDFHHVVAGKMPVSSAAGRGLASFQKEINRCIVACATCHRKIHGGLLKATPSMIKSVKVPKLRNTQTGGNSMSSEAALKAWETRRKNARSEIAKKAAKTRKLRQAGKKAAKTRKRRAAAKKAWVTRRLNAK